MAQEVRDGSGWSVKWFLAFASVLLAAVAMIYAMTRCQPIKEISPDGVTWYSGDEEIPVADIERAQSELKDRVDRLDEQVQSNTSAAPVDAANFAGQWWGDNGLRYDITQDGGSAAITEVSPYGITSYGMGTVSGQWYSFTFTVYNGLTGSGSLELTGSQQLQGSFQSAYGTAWVTMTRGS